MRAIAASPDTFARRRRAGAGGRGRRHRARRGGLARASRPARRSRPTTATSSSPRRRILVPALVPGWRHAARPARSAAAPRASRSTACTSRGGWCPTSTCPRVRPPRPHVRARRPADERGHPRAGQDQQNGGRAPAAHRAPAASRTTTRRAWRSSACTATASSAATPRSPRSRRSSPSRARRSSRAGGSRRDADWEALRALEPRFAGVAVTDPAYPDAQRLRARWRLEVGDRRLLEEGVDMIDRRLFPMSISPDDAILRARLSAKLGNARGGAQRALARDGVDHAQRRGAHRGARPRGPAADPADARAGALPDHHRAPRRLPAGPGAVRLARLDRPLAWAAIGALLVLTALALERRVSWYLSVDQFGYLTFADDLPARPRVPPLAARVGAGAGARRRAPTCSRRRTCGITGGCRRATRPDSRCCSPRGQASSAHDAAPLSESRAVPALLLGVLVAFEARIARLAWAGTAPGARGPVAELHLALGDDALARRRRASLRRSPGCSCCCPRATRQPGARRPRRGGRRGGPARLRGVDPSGRDPLRRRPRLALLLWRRGREPARASLAATAAAALLGLLVGLAPSLAYNASRSATRSGRRRAWSSTTSSPALVAAPRRARGGAVARDHARPRSPATRFGSCICRRCCRTTCRSSGRRTGRRSPLLALWGIAVAAAAPLAARRSSRSPTRRWRSLFYSCWARSGHPLPLRRGAPGAAPRGRGEPRHARPRATPPGARPRRRSPRASRRAPRSAASRSPSSRRHAAGPHVGAARPRPAAAGGAGARGARERSSSRASARCPPSAPLLAVALTLMTAAMAWPALGLPRAVPRRRDAPRACRRRRARFPTARW